MELLNVARSALAKQKEEQSKEEQARKLKSRNRFIRLLQHRCFSILNVWRPIKDDEVVPIDNKPYFMEIDGLLFTLVKRSWNGSRFYNTLATPLRSEDEDDENLLAVLVDAANFIKQPTVFIIDKLSDLGLLDERGIVWFSSADDLKYVKTDSIDIKEVE